jgi:sodium-independent sulfate anion transporter 11
MADSLQTVAVMSTLVGNIVIEVQDQHPDIPAPEIARSLSLIAGCIVLFIGLARIAWVVEFIPLTAIQALMSSAAITVAIGQVPTMMGIKGIDTRDPVYQIFINTLKNMDQSRLDAAMGLTALVMLYLIREICNHMTI